MNLESPVASMGSRQRLFDSWFCGTKNGAPRGRRIIHGEVDEEKEFQYANPHCLSSYYSVFVARLTIMVMLAILIGMLTILTWHFTRVYTTKSINNLAYSLRYELLQRPILRMWNILNSTAEITTAQVKLSEYVIRQHENPMSQAKEAELYETMRNITWALFASRKALSAITISYKNGFVQAFHRDHRNNNTFYIYSDIVNSTSEKSHRATDTESLDEGWRIRGNSSEIWYREPLDPVTGETTGEQKPIPPDDLINIARISEIPDGVASWHVTVGKLTNSPMLSAALPVRDSPNGSIVAVVGVTTELYSVGQLMKELMEFHSGYMYLTSREGYLLATSSNTPLLRNVSGGPNLMMAVDSEDRMIRLGAKWLEGASGNEFQRNDEVHAENVRLGHHQYYIDSFFLKLKRLPLVGVIIIPRKYVMGKVDQRALTTLVILISASLCILVIGCVCILILTSGVSKEMNLRAELITQLDARRQAEASSNYKSQFLANMSHELRTPMAAVIGLLDILVCDDCLTNEQYATVTQIRKCSAALLGLLNNILDLSKVESGKLVLEQAEFDLGRELEGLVDMFSVQCMKHNVEIVLDLSDDMPKLVLGDSARVIQIFANLISNSIKFTSSGHVILRGWCESSNSATHSEKLPLDQKSQSVFRANTKKQPDHAKGNIKSGNKTTLWFEVDDTGCGIDPSKWESVFESFEQADPSTTRTYGGTGLGLCIVRTLVKKMGGDIKVVKKDGPGTLMQLHLVLNAPLDCALYGGDMEFTKHSLTVLLALNGTMGRSIISCWLRRNGVYTWEASEWNELTQILQEVFTSNNRIPKSGFKIECSTWESSRDGQVDTSGISKTVIVLDIGLLDLSTNIWKEQLKFLDKYHAKAKFAWVLNHDACNAIKMELRQKGHLVMVNKPLYKAKMIHILEAAIKESNLELQRKGGHPSRISTVDADLHECLEIDPFHSEVTSSDDSDVSDGGSTNLKGHAVYQAGEKPVQQIARYHSPQSNGLNNSSVELIQVNSTENKLNLKADSPQIRRTNFDIEGSSHLSYRGRISALTELKSVLNEHQMSGSGLRQQGRVDSIKVASGQRSLEGLCILLVEDTPILQKVATIMLEKMGAIVVSVGDGLQAVEALKCLSGADCRRWELLSQVGATMSQTPFSEFPDFDLILMDCQMPNMDGYEATKAIRKMEEGCEVHIPIVALTAHAMSSDEAKCLEVGMDAYLTKPIDCKLMTSTILSLTKSKRMV